jgi:hypothetical protein
VKTALVAVPVAKREDSRAASEEDTTAISQLDL